MTISRIEAKLDALIDALGFDVMIGEVYAGECVICYGAHEIGLADAKRKHYDNIVKVAPCDGSNVIAVFEIKQDVKLIKKKPRTDKMRAIERAKSNSGGVIK